MAETKTVDEIAYDRVTYKLGEQASAQRVLASIVERKAPDADRLIAAHKRTAEMFDLLLCSVQNGLLDRLERKVASRG